MVQGQRAGFDRELAAFGAAQEAGRSHGEERKTEQEKASFRVHRGSVSERGIVAGSE
jgi:hypothetical protein